VSEPPGLHGWRDGATTGNYTLSVDIPGCRECRIADEVSVSTTPVSVSFRITPAVDHVDVVVDFLWIADGFDELIDYPAALAEGASASRLPPGASTARA
jgi:hypothetical protein